MNWTTVYETLEDIQKYLERVLVDMLSGGDKG